VPDDSVGVVVCGLALMHVPDLEPVFGEFGRVLRPGGHLVISDWRGLIGETVRVPFVQVGADGRVGYGPRSAAAQATTSPRRFRSASRSGRARSPFARIRPSATTRRRRTSCRESRRAFGTCTRERARRRTPRIAIRRSQSSSTSSSSNELAPRLRPRL
jgi:SAM-dependent methyltransferase